MAVANSSNREACSSALDSLDRIAIAYLTLPLAIFLAGWLEPLVAIPLIACVAYALKPLGAPLPDRSARPAITRLQLVLAIAVGCGWTVFGGTEHWLFANADWHLRDAVLHDLVVGQWPVGYGPLDGRDTLLRAPLGYYLPAALIGKWGGLPVAHFAMAVWTALGATLFLLQVISQTPSRPVPLLTVAAVLVLFSGLDLIGNFLVVPHFIAHWDVARHLEWWAADYQYSSMTTQLFWVPNHALGGWLTIGLLGRAAPSTVLDSMLPMIVVAVALWSPLTALGAVPFVFFWVLAATSRERLPKLLHPRVWAPALLVGLAVAAYLTLDSGRIARGWIPGRSGAGAADIAKALLHQAEFFLLEAGFIGIAILAVRRSTQVVLALVLLALIPLVSFGPSNDWAMRGSIPSLTVLAVAAALALCREGSNPGAARKKVILGCLLAVGAITPLQEFARAVLLRPWPIDLQSTLVGAACGRYPAHYVARLGRDGVAHVLRKVHPLPLGLSEAERCENPAVGPMRERGLL